MVKKSIIIVFLLFVLLSSFSFHSQDLAYFEKIVNKQSIDESLKILKDGKEKGELKPFDYLFLYYLLKAQGESENAIYSLLQGFENCDDEISASVLIDTISSEFSDSPFLEKIIYETIERKKDKFSDPLLKNVITNILYIKYLRKVEKSSADKVLDDGGIPSGFFYKFITDENPKLRFVNSDYKDIVHSNLNYAERDGFMLHIPTSMLNTSSNFLALKSIPFEVFEDAEIDMTLNVNSPIKIFLDGKPALIRNSFERILPPKEALTFKAKKGIHIIDILYYSINDGDGIYLSLLKRDGYGKEIKYLNAIPDVEPTDKIEEISEKKITVNSEKGLFGRIVNALYKEFLGNLPLARLEFNKLIEENPDSVLLKILYMNLIIKRSYDLPLYYGTSIGEKITESILENNPECPEALYYDVLLKSSSSQQKEEILSQLRSICERFPKDSRWFIELARQLESFNFIAEAKDVLLKAEELFPENYSIQQALFDFYKNRGDFEKCFKYLEKISKHRVVYSEYERYHSERGEYLKAIEYLFKEKELFGNFDFFFEKNMLYYLLKMEKYDEALKISDLLLEANPESEEFLTLKGKILAKMGKKEEAFNIFKKIKDISPKYFDYDYAQWLLTGDLPFENERISYENAIKNYVDNVDGASSSYVLDHQISLIQRDGSTIERYHGIVKIYDKQGVENEGEVQFPSDYLLMLRTVKPDGRIIEPEYVSAKRTIGMTGLEVGDIIEYEYFNLTPPNEIKKGSFYNSYVFLFQDIEKPFFHTCFTVKYPKDFKMDFYDQNLPDKVQTYEENGLIIRKYDFNEMPRIAYEPSAPYKDYYLPLVDMTANVSWDDFFNYLKDTFLGSFLIGVEIEEKAKELASGMKSDDEKIDAVVDFVLDEIEGENERWADPTETLLTGQGNRLQLALAMLKSLGVNFEIILAESNDLRYDRNPLPTQGRFRIPLIKINSKVPYYLDLEDSYGNPKILPVYLQGAKFISLSNDSFKVQNLPENYEPFLNCSEKEKRVVDKDGNLSVTFNQVLDPDRSRELRRILKQVERDRWKEVLQVAFSRQFGNAEIGNFEFRNIDEIEKNLEIFSEIYVSSFGTRTENKLKIDNLYDRSELSKAFATLQKRELPLSISQPIILNQEYSVTLPSGKILSFEKKKKKIDSKFGKYSLDVKRKKGEIFIKRFLYIYEQQISKEEYPQFADFLKLIDEVETTSIEIDLEK